MTVEENEGPNKIAPVIAQDGKDIRVDLEASMPVKLGPIQLTKVNLIDELVPRQKAGEFLQL
jgi:hypothetical protein